MGWKLTHCLVQSMPISCLRLKVKALFVKSGVDLLFGLERTYLIELEINSLLVKSKIDLSYIFSLLRGCIQGGVLE